MKEFAPRRPFHQYSCHPFFVLLPQSERRLDGGVIEGGRGAPFLSCSPGREEEEGGTAEGKMEGKRDILIKHLYSFPPPTLIPHSRDRRWGWAPGSRPKREGETIQLGAPFLPIFNSKCIFLSDARMLIKRHFLKEVTYDRVSTDEASLSP